MGSTLLQKVWDAHTVRRLPSGQTQLYVGLHLIHEVTTPQAFDMLRARGLGVRQPDRTVATVDHIVPTEDQRRPFGDLMAEDMLAALERNCREAGIELYDLGSGAQGIVHVIGPGARAHAAGDDDRLRRQPYVHARRVRRGGVRHRHVAGARRARIADAWRSIRSRCGASASPAG
jgi:homoaconitase/3-isopropylmalate dehydratase large subunit